MKVDCHPPVQAQSGIRCVSFLHSVPLPLYASCLTPLYMQPCTADIEQLAVVWHDIQQLVTASEGSLSLGGLSAILMTSALNRLAHSPPPAMRLSPSSMPLSQPSGHGIAGCWRRLCHCRKSAGRCCALFSPSLLLSIWCCEVCCRRRRRRRRSRCEADEGPRLILCVR
jgi:hypothetical protein